MKQNTDYQRTIGLEKSPAFFLKMLATYVINIGLLCGHLCRYCSTPAMVNKHKLFRKAHISSFSFFQDGGTIVDSDTPNRIVKRARKLKASDVVLMSSITDPYSPEAQEHNLGRRCAEIVLKESKATLRVLTKNAAVMKDFDLFAQYPGRVIVGLSVTAPPSKQNIIDVLEPNASPIAERLAAYEKAKEMGIRTFGMLCPLLPGIADKEEDIHELMETMLRFGAEDIWVEPVNCRGKSLTFSQKTLEEAGMATEAFRIGQIRNAEMHQIYAYSLIEAATNVAKDLGCLDRLKMLIYNDKRTFTGDDSAVIWL
jgi:DNA repair photolyase